MEQNQLRYYIFTDNLKLFIFLIYIHLVLFPKNFNYYFSCNGKLLAKHKTFWTDPTSCLKHCDRTYDIHFCPTWVLWYLTEDKNHLPKQAIYWSTFFLIRMQDLFLRIATFMQRKYRYSKTVNKYFPSMLLQNTIK